MKHLLGFIAICTLCTCTTGSSPSSSAEHLDTITAVSITANEQPLTEAPTTGHWPVSKKQAFVVVYLSDPSTAQEGSAGSYNPNSTLPQDPTMGARPFIPPDTWYYVSNIFETDVLDENQKAKLLDRAEQICLRYVSSPHVEVVYRSLVCFDTYSQASDSMHMHKDRKMFNL